MKKKFFLKNLILFIVPLLIPLITLGSFSISLTQDYIRDDIDKNNIKMLNQTKETVELIFNELDSLSINFELNPSVVIKVKEQLERKQNDYESINTMDFIMDLMNPPVNSKPYIQSIYIYYKNNNQGFFVSNQGIENLSSFVDSSWHNSFISNTSAANTWIETRDTKLFHFESEKTKLITLYKKLYSPGSIKADGVIVMNIRREYVENMLKDLVSYNEQTILIVDAENKVISATGSNPDISEADIKKINANPLSFFGYKSDKGSMMVSQIKSDRYPLKYVSIIPRSSLYKVPTQLIYMTGLLLLISFLLGLAITYSITRKNYNHLRIIISTLESAEKGDPLPNLPSRIKDEYGFILQNIIKTFIEQSYLKIQLSEKKYRLKAIEMMALQSQMNPHFLFNTLKTLYWKTIGLTGDQNEASKMIEHLSGIMHYSLGSSDKTVSLEEEIQNTQSYIEIQKVRYKDKFGVTWQYNDSIVKQKVLKLLFQPFIENAIYHGIKEKEGSSYIKIKISLVNSLLKIAIIDNGLGMEKEQLEKIRAKLSEDGEYSEHIGLFNTNKRLILMYGDQYGIKIRSKLRLGTVVYIDIPSM